MCVYIYIYIYTYIHIITCVSYYYITVLPSVREESAPPKRNTLWKTGSWSTRSGAGEQLLPQDCRTKALGKGGLFSDTAETRRSLQVSGSTLEHCRTAQITSIRGSSDNDTESPSNSRCSGFRDRLHCAIPLRGSFPDLESGSEPFSDDLQICWRRYQRSRRRRQIFERPARRPSTRATALPSNNTTHNMTKNNNNNNNSSSNNNDGISNTIPEAAPRRRPRNGALGGSPRCV